MAALPMPQLTPEDEKAYRRRYRQAVRRLTKERDWLQSQVNAGPLPDMIMAMATEDVERVIHFLQAQVEG